MFDVAHALVMRAEFVGQSDMLQVFPGQGTETGSGSPKVFDGKLSARAVFEEAEQAFEPGVGILVDLLRHGVIHER